MDPAAWTFVILGLSVVAFLVRAVGAIAIVSVGVTLRSWVTGILDPAAWRRS